ncbi:MAG: carotenoid oxygenase family protein [Gammaproteobacteria bacterium]|nr:carotenoid oxygenase family protein [Gammaproteobacteria bacterium]
MAHFPNSPLYQEVLHLGRLEGDITDLELEGEVPAGLDGAFFRVHPDPQFPPMYPNDQFFNGDGMVSQFRIKNGRINFKQRYAQTDKWKLERAAGRPLFGVYRNAQTDDPSVAGKIRGTANTNVLVHAGKLFAMKEDSPCLIMDQNSLETSGYTDFDGQLTIPTFTAHPKIDPDTGNFCGFGYAVAGPLTRECQYFEIDPNGTVVRKADFKVPYYTMLHDFAIAGDYAVFNVSPYFSSQEILDRKMPHFMYDRKLPFYLGVVRRDGDGSDMRWFKIDPSICGCHVMNGFQDGTKVSFDFPISKTTSLPFFPEADGTPFNKEEATTYLTRLTVDLASSGDEITSIERIGKAPGEFPRIDDRFAGKPYRNGWMITYDFDKPYNGPSGPFVGVINSLTHYDHQTGTEKSWWCGPDGALQEPAFIPRTADSAEGDGYLIALVDDHMKNYSDLCIFDALNVDKGPVCRAKLPFRLRQGLHGNWVDGSKLGG